MSRNKKLEKNNKNSIPSKIIEAISNLEQDYFIRSESYPFYPSDNFNLSEIFDESKNIEKEKDEKECKIGNYLIKKTLGKGTFGKVKLGIYIPTQEKVAIKILEKSKIIEKDDEIRVKREFEMLTLFNHPNVILVAEIFENSGSFFSVMEYCEGGELFNYIVRNRRLSQNEAAFFYYQLINGLEYIHSLGIVHRDLKPENLLLTKDHILKIIDFGLSNYFRKNQRELLLTPCGSPCYASPEMVAGKKYNGFKIDIWSTGIILYAMLCGYLPFEDKDNDILFQKILECKIIFPKFISKMGKDLIQKILVTNPNKRITIKEIKKHPFYLKGKELFESQFSISQNEKEIKQFNTDNSNDINNICNIHILKDITGHNENKKNHNIKKRNKNEKSKEKNVGKETIMKKKEKLKLNDFEKENLMVRLKTEGDEDKQALTLRNNYLPELDKEINDYLGKIDNHSSKKIIKNNKIHKSKNKNINKENIQFKKRNIIYTKQNNIKDNLKIVERPNKKEFNPHKKLIKTNKYNNIKNQHPRNHIIGKSVNNRKINYKIKDNNFIQHNNNYTNVIKSKFNSKEKFDKNKINKKENIYANNINNIIKKENNNKKLKLGFKFGLYNSIENTHKKNNSTAKKNMKITPFQTIDNQKENKNYLYNLFNFNSNIKKYKKEIKSIQLNGIKLNDELKMKLRTNFYNDISKEEQQHKKLNTDILSGEKIKINKDKLNLAKIYNNKIKPKKDLINIIDNTEVIQDSKNQIQKQIDTLDVDGEYLIDNHEINNPKTNRETMLKKNLMNLRYYMNEIGKNNTYRKERENARNHKKGLKSELLNSIEAKKTNNFNLKKMLINDYNKKTNNNKEKILILENLTNDDINLNTIDNINRTEPNQIIHKIKKIKNNHIKDNNQQLSSEVKHIQQKINKKTSINKNIHINPNNSIQNKKINLNENKINKQSNYENYFNKTSNEFKYIKDYSLLNQIGSKYNNIFDSVSVEQDERDLNNNSVQNANNNNTKYKKKKNIISSLDKKPCFTIKNTVINLNIDTGFIIHPLDKKEKIKQENSNKSNNYLIKNFDDSNNIKYEQSNKNHHYINKERIAKNIIHHNTNENQFQTVNNDNNNILLLKDNFIGVKKKISNKMIANRDKRFSKIDENQIFNKSLNNDIKRHIKFKSMKLDEISGKKYNKKKITNLLYLKTNQNFSGC